MSPSIHREDKKQVSVWMTPEERQMLEEVMRENGDQNMTDLIKRLIREAHKNKVEKKHDDK